MNKVNAVEIFSVGEWNGDEYTLDDLQIMVDAFEETKTGVRPYLKLGHDNNQKLLQADGLPSAGWVERMYILGDKLMADFTDIPQKIYELILKKAYRKVSSEIFWNIKVGEKTYKRMLAGIALLGSDTPGVMNLSDILAMYSKQKGTYDKLSLDNVLEFKFSSQELTQEGVSMKTENEIKLEYTLSQKESELKEKSDALDLIKKASQEAEAELADLKKFKVEAEAKQIELEKKAQTAQIEKYVTDLKSEKLCTPAMAPLVIELLGEEKKEYTVKVSDKEQKLSKAEVLKETLKLFKAAQDVNFEENSDVADKTQADNEKELDQKAKEYSQKHNVSYSIALKTILKEVKG